MVRERRKRTRVPVNFDLHIVMLGEAIPVQTNNISLAGVSFSSDRKFAPGARCVVHLRLNKEVDLKMEARILRSQDRETIATFLEMDENSFYHLKKIMMYNAADSEQIEKELSKPAFT
ncbi:MAG TPA: PilZ domain-containing protein [Smithellaceae bacterium]|jgi:hypothetical protein|nr:PilZ domain-containing protein [Syntrophaceae bacterium]HPL96048.1 PilZ domain-containing protein [Smithellaceae bacterium]HPV48609.1 PilZ domain-containing protein [Smithellaceae bacterium]